MHHPRTSAATVPLARSPRLAASAAFAFQPKLVPDGLICTNVQLSDILLAPHGNVEGRTHLRERANHRQTRHPLPGDFSQSKKRKPWCMNAGRKNVHQEYVFLSFLAPPTGHRKNIHQEDRKSIHQEHKKSIHQPGKYTASLSGFVANHAGKRTVPPPFSRM